MLHKVLADMRKHIVLLLVCLMGVSGIFFFLNSRKADVYHASFTVVYEELVRKVYGDRLVKLDRLLADNKAKAAELLNLDSNVVAHIKSVKGTNILGEDLSKDMNTDRIPFMVHMYVEDTSYIPAIQNGIVNFLENGNKFLTAKRELKIKEVNEELAFINSQLKMMDSLKNKFSGMKQASKTADEKESGSIYQFSYELYKRKQELTEMQELPLNIYVIDDAIVSVSSKRSYILMAAVGLFLGFIIYLGLVYLLIPALKYQEN